MKRYDRTWPMSLAAIALGGVFCLSVLGPHLSLPITHQPAATLDAPAAPVSEVVVERVVETEHAAASTPLTHLVHLTTDEVLHILRSSPVAEDRRNAAVFLGSSTEPGRVLGALMIALRTDDDVTVRFTAAQSLGRLDISPARTPLEVAAMQDEDLRVREAAVAALRALAEPASVPVLASVLNTDSSDDVRAQAGLALLEIGTTTAFTFVTQAMENGLADEINSAWARQLREAVANHPRVFVVR